MTGDSLIGPVPVGWKTTTLGEIVKRGGGHVQTGPFGSQLHASDYVPIGIPSIMPANIGDNKIIEEGIARIRESDAQRLGRHRVVAGDIIYSRRGDVERRALIRPEQEGWLCGTGCLKIRLGDGGVTPKFTSYYLGHPEVRAWIVRHAIGATMPNLNTRIMEAVPFVVPPLEEQQAIACILGALDDKIELNRRMNETLEAMARAIFKSWFVDFDPVRAKANGQQPPGLAPHIADLFPDAFGDSELGKIPKGRSITTLENMVHITKGRSYKSSELMDSDTALVTLKSFARGGGYRPDGLKPYVGPYKPEQVVQPGELVIACTDVTQAAQVIGRPAIVRGSRRFKTLVGSLDTLIMRPNPGALPRAFLYFLGGTDAFTSHMFAHTTGTTVLHLAKEAVPSFRFVKPMEATVDVFDRLASPLVQRMDTVETENDILAALRDSLLPKLISGDIGIAQAERIVGRTL